MLQLPDGSRVMRNVFPTEMKSESENTMNSDSLTGANKRELLFVCDTAGSKIAVGKLVVEMMSKCGNFHRVTIVNELPVLGNIIIKLTESGSQTISGTFSGDIKQINSVGSLFVAQMIG